MTFDPSVLWVLSKCKAQEYGTKQMGAQYLANILTGSGYLTGCFCLHQSGLWQHRQACEEVFPQLLRR